MFSSMWKISYTCPSFITYSSQERGGTRGGEGEKEQLFSGVYGVETQVLCSAPLFLFLAAKHVIGFVSPQCMVPGTAPNWKACPICVAALSNSGVHLPTDI